MHAVPTGARESGSDAPAGALGRPRGPDCDLKMLGPPPRGCSAFCVTNTQPQRPSPCPGFNVGESDQSGQYTGGAPKFSAEILEAGPRPGPHAGRRPHISAGLGRRILWHAIPPLSSAQVCAVRPNLAPPDQARSRPAPRRPARPQAAFNVRRSLRGGH